MRLALVAALVMAVACGGSEKKVDEPSGGGDDDGEEVDNSGSTDNMVSQEVLDGIRGTFERKVTIIARCFGEAMEAGELTKKDKVIMTISTTIKPDGSASGTEITKTNASSETLRACVIRHVDGWTFPAPPSDLQFSHIYKFEEF